MKLLKLQEALSRPASVYPRPAEAIEQNYFGGLTNEKIGEALGILRATVERDLRLRGCGWRVSRGEISFPLQLYMRIRSKNRR